MELRRSRRRTAALLAALLVNVSLAVCVSASEGEEEVLAIPSNVQDQRGLELADGRLWFSAFVNVAFESLEHQSDELNLDDVGILVRWDANDRFSFFVALEVEDLVTWLDDEGWSFANESPHVERLRMDVSLGAETTLRIGKTLTPFGIWNPIRRAPLTWTVDRPLVTEIAFPLHVTGFDLNHKATVGGWSIDSDLYGQPAGELDRLGDEKSAKAFVGGRIAAGHSLPAGFATVGVQAAWFEDHFAHDQEYAVGVDLDMTIARQLITSEVIFFDGEIDEQPAWWGAYLQVVSPIWRGLFAVARGETVGLRDADDYGNVILGLAWRAQNDRWVLKLNYQFSRHEVDGRSDGVGVALSFLF